MLEMTDSTAGPPAAKDVGCRVDAPYYNTYKIVLDNVGTYSIWVFCMTCVLEDANCVDASATIGHSSDSKARRLTLSHIGYEIIKPLLDKSAIDTWAALKGQRSERMKYRKLHLLTKLHAMNIGAHARVSLIALIFFTQVLQASR